MNGVLKDIALEFLHSEPVSQTLAEGVSQCLTVAEQHEFGLALRNYLRQYQHERDRLVGYLSCTQHAIEFVTYVSLSLDPRQYAKRQRAAVPAVERSLLRLFEYQVGAVRHILEARGSILAFDTGHGKTLVVIAASQALLDANPDLKISVVLPLSLIDNFRKGMERYGLNRHDARYTFFTYEDFRRQFQRNPELVRGHLLICDEAHHLRTSIYPNLRVKLNAEFKRLEKLPVAERTDVPRHWLQHKARILAAFKACQALPYGNPVAHMQTETGINLLPFVSQALAVVLAGLTAYKAVLMTATPCFNATYDVANLISVARGQGVMSPRYFAENEANPEFFRDLFAFKTIEERDPDFPQIREHVVPIEMDDTYYREYHKVEMDANRTFGDPWAFCTGVRQSTLGISPNPKCAWTVGKIAENLDAGRKCLVFSSFITHGLRTIQVVLTSMGIKWAEITGETKAPDRQAAVESFNIIGGAGHDVLFVSAAGGEGIDTKGCRVIVLLESEWNRPHELQVIGRGPRRGSHNHLPPDERFVDVYRLVMVKPPRARRLPTDRRDQSADQILADIVQRKQAKIGPFLARLQSVAIVTVH